MNEFLKKNYIMTGVLVKKNGGWIIQYDKGHEILFYELDQNCKEWSKRKSVTKFIHEGIEVDFKLITSGFHNKEQNYIVKEYNAVILHINHETI